MTQYFSYSVCNAICPVVCDTAQVAVSIAEIDECYAPNAFTPNADGSNDLFIIPCINHLGEKASLVVFNRWGNPVYETDNYTNDWDGTHRNNPLPNGTYFYVLQINGKRPQKGSIEIRR